MSYVGGHRSLGKDAMPLHPSAEKVLLDDLTSFSPRSCENLLLLDKLNVSCARSCDMRLSVTRRHDVRDGRQGVLSQAENVETCTTEPLQ